jgi:hypothetical protein
MPFLISFPFVGEDSGGGKALTFPPIFPHAGGRGRRGKKCTNTYCEGS